MTVSRQADKMINIKCGFLKKCKDYDGRTEQLMRQSVKKQTKTKLNQNRARGNQINT